MVEFCTECVRELNTEEDCYSLGHHTPAMMYLLFYCPNCFEKVAGRRLMTKIDKQGATIPDEEVKSQFDDEVVKELAEAVWNSPLSEM